MLIVVLMDMVTPCLIKDIQLSKAPPMWLLYAMPGLKEIRIIEYTWATTRKRE
jgi:hypothetical protein